MNTAQINRKRSGLNDLSVRALLRQVRNRVSNISTVQGNAPASRIGMKYTKAGNAPGLWW